MKAKNKTPAQQLGDCHNFGRQVVEREGRIIKPRTVFWEWLFLSADSPLRQSLVAAAERSRLSNQYFDFLPEMKFTNVRAREGGEVERLQLEPLPELSSVEKEQLTAIVGKSLAFWSYFGVADLHWENVALGRNAEGRIILTPLDIEMVLADLTHPTDTKWIPDADPDVADVCRHAAGVRRVLPYLGKPVAVEHLMIMAREYLRMLDVLGKQTKEIAQALAEIPDLKDIPIRVCLRGTDEYVVEDSDSLWPPLLDEEMEQLDRGDIPYFFRLYNQPGIHYFSEKDLSEFDSLPTEGDVPQLEPLLQVSKDLRSKSRKTLREEGLLTVIGAFDHKSFKGVHVREGLEITFQKKTLIVKFPDGEEIEAHRDLREFVGSVYVPCRCGEVFSVYVPRVTSCEWVEGAGEEGPGE